MTTTWTRSEEERVTYERAVRSHHSGDPLHRYLYFIFSDRKMFINFISICPQVNEMNVADLFHFDMKRESQVVFLLKFRAEQQTRKKSTSWKRKSSTISVHTWFRLHYGYIRYDDACRMNGQLNGWEICSFSFQSLQKKTFSRLLISRRKGVSTQLFILVCKHAKQKTKIPVFQVCVRCATSILYYIHTPHVEHTNPTHHHIT